MKLSVLHTSGFVIASILAFAGCSNSTGNGGQTGGQLGSGGAPGSGGKTGSGGISGMGGSASAGGITGNGGTGLNTAGITASGGTVSNTGGGGGAIPSTGGVNASGGTIVKTGGVSGSGGISAAGGSGACTTCVGGAAMLGGSVAGGAPGAGGQAVTTGSALIKNDVFWKDTSGNNIYSQGGGVLQVGDTYYWYGVSYKGAADYAANPSGQKDLGYFVAVTTYSSKDLATWKFEGNALTYDSMASKLTMSKDPYTWIGRVGAAYNPTSKKYVIIGQYLGTPDTQQFFATSDTPNGAFTVAGTQAVITNVSANNCGDQSIFTDDDGKAYILCSSLSGRSNTYIVPLRPADYLQAQPATKIFGGAGREGNAMFKYNKRYYVCSSDLHGWNASHSYYISATNIMGPYDTEAIIGNTDADFSHVTQTGLFVTVKGSKQELVIFGGDRWSDFAGNGIGYNQWMPLTFSGIKPSMDSLSEWYINAGEGTYSVGPGNNYALNPSFEADRVTISPPAGWTTSASNYKGGHTGDFAMELTGSASLDQKIASLPNGTYTLAVWAKSSSGSLYAKGSGGTDKTISLTAGSSWTKISLTGIAVSNGTCSIGVSGASGFVDDFTIVKN